MIPEDVTHFLPGEGGEEVQQQEPAPVETPVETVTFKVRGEERQIPASILDSLAESLGTSRDAAQMWLQTGKDAGSHYNELRQRERELAQREYELQQRASQPPPQPQYPQYGQPTHQQFQQHPQQNGLPEDPIDLLRWQAQRLQALEERINTGFRATEEQQKHFAIAYQEEQNRVQGEQIQSAFKHLVESKKSAGLPVPDYETIEREMLESGLAQNRNLTWDQAFDRAYKNVYFDDYGRMAERRAMEKLRDPKAQVTVPGPNSSAPPAPPKQTAETLLGGMTMGQGLDFIPESRR